MNHTFLRRAYSLQTNFNKVRSVWLIIIGVVFLFGIVDSTNLQPVIIKALTSLWSTIPFIIIAVFLVAYLKSSGAERIISKSFQGREVKVIFLAALVGGLAPFCSCEVIPFIASMLALGIPLSAVMAFWLSSPLINPPTLLITARALGWDYAVAKTLSALSLGLFGGFESIFFQEWVCSLHH